ncbi:MAG: antitoxin MazE [Thermoanaerobaculia bacterium]|jgi:antitoxin MazE|nr:antitoxin MazE [Thermoanaerobaculia bacterium]
MRTRIHKLRKRRVVRIPKALALEVGLEEDREDERCVDKGRLVTGSPIVPSYTLTDLLAGIRRSNLHRETDWGPRSGTEIW